MKAFKKAAIKVLQEEGKPLHAKEITKLAIKRGYLVTEGKTPEATMNALLVVDTNKNSKKSLFEKTGPQTFKLRDILKAESGSFSIEGGDTDLKKTWTFSKNVSSKQKGDIAESRVAELITLYGSETLSCYKPISDDDGIDLIVKRKKNLDSVFIQVKSRYGDDPKAIYTANVKTETLVKSKKMFVVFCFFDKSEGDLWDYLWLIPADVFIVKANELMDGKMLGFVSGRTRNDSNKWDKYMIEKKDLANELIKHFS